MKNLTKTKYVKGVRCLKALYLNVYQPELGKEPDESQKMIMAQGQAVGEFAKKEFKGGVDISKSDGKFDEQVRLTKEALKKDVPAIFEATFLHEGVLCKVDILERTKKGWNLIEVKSSTKVTEEHIHDVAVQYAVLKGAGIQVERAYLMLVNTACIYPDLSNFFKKEDVTKEVEMKLSEVKGNLKKQFDVLKSKREPKIDIGEYCLKFPGNKKPRACEFKEHCWKHIKENSVFELYRLKKEKQFDLYTSGVLQIKALPKGYKLNAMQERQVEAVFSKAPYMDKAGIGDFLSQIEYPVHYLDFETANPAIPRFKGIHPYEHIPFQFSCFVREENGNLLYREFLQLGTNDPREALLKALLEGIQNRGSIFVYNAVFEKRILKSLAKSFPKYEKKINGIIERIVDMMDIFLNYYYHPDFHGSLSLKKIVPVLAPSLSYEGMEIAEGGSASAAYMRTLTEDLSEIEISAIEKNLREYCKKDTQVMVEIHDFFLNLLSDKKQKKQCLK
ncbi:MAG: DUF2779 domain-containing protein [Deltaproteobacteria bacterium]|nr:DUF2779 domain-containing protein [Deltaproteobacteria bacterium]